MVDQKNKLSATVEQVKKDMQEVTGDVRDVATEIKETVRESVPRPLRRRIQRRVDNIISGRRRRVS